MTFQSTNFKKEFYNKGYFVVRNLLTSSEVEYFANEITKIYNEELHNNIKVKMGISSYENLWKIISNSNLLNNLKEIFDKKFYYLYQAGVLQTDNSNKYLHHRDNPCRKFGLGPDWSNNERYKIARVGIYFQKYNETKFSLNVIPYSHHKKLTLRELLRFFHKKTRSLESILGVRNMLPKIFGTSINTHPGDAIIFDPRLYHSPSPHKNRRQAIFLSYGEDNDHSDNYIAYFTKLRSGLKEELNNEQFLNFLKKNSLLKLPNDEIKFIEGSFL